MDRDQLYRRSILITSFAIFFVAMTTPALAHSVNKRFGDFYGGLLHPITAIEHLLPIVGLSLLAGQRGAESARWVLLLFPVAFLVGASPSSIEIPVDYVIWANRISFVVIGLLVAASVKIPIGALMLISILMGFLHGYENTADIPTNVAMRLFLPGLFASGVLLVSIAAAIAIKLEKPWQKIAVRVAGSWIAAIGLLAMSVT